MEIRKSIGPMGYMAFIPVKSYTFCVSYAYFTKKFEFCLWNRGASLKTIIRTTDIPTMILYALLYNNAVIYV